MELVFNWNRLLPSIAVKDPGMLLLLRSPFVLRRELVRELGILALRGERLGPEAHEEVVRAAVVELADLAAGALVLVEQAADARVERGREHLGLGVVRLDAQVLERDGEREELA